MRARRNPPRRIREAVRRAQLRISLGAPGFAADMPVALVRAISRERDREFPELLSPRERQVLQAQSYGLTEQMVADLYGIAYQTVRTHTSAARFKLGAKNKSHAIAIALREGIIR